MRPLLGLLSIAAIGCSGFAPPTAEQLRELGLSRSPRARSPELYERQRFRMSLDSPWLAGEFEGVVVARRGGTRTAIRAQLFGDLGPKSLDLLARPERIVGFLPQARSGVDCALPAEAAPHPLLFLGVSLLEEYSERSEDRVLGIREEEGGWWVLLRSEVEGLEVVEFSTRDHLWVRRRFRWMRGVSWEQERMGTDELAITAPGVSIRVKILERGSEAPRNPEVLDLVLPSDIHLVQGSRK